MRLPAVPVHSMEDATLNFEALQALGVLGSLISSSVQVNAGLTTWVFTASPFATTIISHGLGRTPKFCVAFPGIVGGQQPVIPYQITTFTNTQVRFDAQTWNQAAVTQTISLFWLAIG